MAENALNLAIGSSLEMDSMANDDLTGLVAEITGFETNKHLTITHPLLSEKEVQISEGDKFFVCLNQGGSDITFESEIIEILNLPLPQVRISYPESVRPGTLRKSNRIVPAPADVRIIGTEVSDTPIVSMLNISCSGACLVSEKILGHINDQFQIELVSTNSQFTVILDCMIRHIQTITEKDHTSYHHGVVFFGMDAEQQLVIWKFFQESAAYLKQD